MQPSQTVPNSAYIGSGISHSWQSDTATVVDAARAAVKTRARNNAIDAMRYLLAFTVVVGHSLPWRAGGLPTWVAFIAFACRGTVPFFFIVSGYYLRPGASLFATISRPFRRLMPVFVFWVLIYICFLPLSPMRAGALEFRNLLWGGPAYHLWFVSALAFSLVFVGVCQRFIGEWATGVVSFLLAVITVLTSTYQTILHLHGLPTHTEPLAGPLLVFMGMLLARHPIGLALPARVIFALAAYLALAAEELLISRLSGTGLTSHNFIFASFICGVAVFLLVQALPDTRFIRKVAAMGSLSLSVYASHLIFVWLLVPVIGNNDLLHLTYVSVSAFACATVVAVVLGRVTLLRIFVR